MRFHIDHTALSKAFLIFLAGLGIGFTQDMDIQGDGSNGNIVLQGRNVSTALVDKIGVKGVSVPAPFYGNGVWGEGGYQGVVGVAQMAGGGTRRGVAGNASGATGQYSANYGVWGSGAGSNSFGVYSSGNLGYTGALINASDARLKKNIAPLTGNLSALMGLKPKKYEYRADEFADMDLDKGEHYGLLAQDVEMTFPNLVHGGFFNTKNDPSADENTLRSQGKDPVNTTAYKGIDYVGLIPVLIGAIQEQQAQIADLTKKLAKAQK